MKTVFCLMNEFGELLGGIPALGIYAKVRNGRGFQFENKQECEDFLAINAPAIGVEGRGMKPVRGLVFDKHGKFILSESQED